MKQGIIRVRRQVSRIDGKIVEAPLKTKNSYRTLTISPQAVEVLKTQKVKTNDDYIIMDLSPVFYHVSSIFGNYPLKTVNPDKAVRKQVEIPAVLDII